MLDKFRDNCNENKGLYIHFVAGGICMTACAVGTFVGLEYGARMLDDPENAASQIIGLTSSTILAFAGWFHGIPISNRITREIVGIDFT